MKKSILALMAVVALAPAAALAQAQEPVRVGGSVKAPERVRYVPPVYPIDAQQARVSGMVILEAVIGTGGDVVAIKVLKSVPMLDEAAAAAVKQWEYTPTTLNGVPVPVIMTVTVNFTVGAGPMRSEQGVPQIYPIIQSPVSTAPAPELNGVQAIRIGGQVMAPERLKYVPPVYPDLAQQAGITGILILEAIIDQDGNVATAKVLKSIPMLDQSALDAVMQWKYTPTLLNGVAVPVVMTVTVNFSIGGR